MSRRLLVTGGFGYLGSRVAKFLADQPDTEVTLGSRSKKVAPTWLPNCKVADTKWGDMRQLQEVCADIDMIIHMAAMNEIEAAQDPVEALRSTALITAELVEAAKHTNVSRFVYLSTAHVYGSPLVGLIDESSCPRPIHPYATSHRAAEDVVIAAHLGGEFDGVVLRLSNGIGAPAYPEVNRWTLLVNDLCRQAVTDKVLTLRSSGLQRRDFITLTDMSSAVLHMLNLSREKLQDGIFNVGGEWAPTVLEMAELVASRCVEVLGYCPSIARPSPVEGDLSQNLNFDVDKIKRTGYRLTLNIEAEIDATLVLCRQSFL